MSAPYYADDSVTLWHGDALEVLRELPEQSVDCCVTSPPYFGLRDYGEEGQYGLEGSPAEYVEKMRTVFAEVRRVLADDGTLWLNIGDSYANTGNAASGETRGRARTVAMAPRINTAGVVGVKNLLGIPWRLAFALQDDGWILRSDIIWAKPNPNPERVKDRPTQAHEYVFLLSKNRTYHYDWAAIAESATGTYERPQFARAKALASERGLTEKHLAAVRSVGMSDAGKAATNQGVGRNTAEVQRLADEAKLALGGYYREFLTGEMKNARDVWNMPVSKFPDAHFAVYPEVLPTRCILAGCKPGGTVLDPFSGSGTTGLAANKHGRKYVGIDLSRDYLDLSLRTRLAQTALLDEEGA